ncbi:MAG: methyltransferase [Janthinobacterium lividum]
MYSNLQLDLAQLDYKKYTWISQLSLLFTFHDGYLIRDTGEEIEIALNGVYNTQVRLLVRNHQFGDVDAIYAAIVHHKYDFLTEIIANIPGLRVLTIANLGAGIGIAAICLAKFFGNAVIRAFEPNKLAFEQLKKNLILNEPESDTIDAYWQYDDMMREVKDFDLLVCSPEAVNQFLLSGEGTNLVTIASIIVVESFLTVEEKNRFIECTSLLHFAHNFFGQTMICWKAERE